METNENYIEDNSDQNDTQKIQINEFSNKKSETSSSELLTFTSDQNKIMDFETNKGEF